MTYTLYVVYNDTLVAYAPGKMTHSAIVEAFKSIVT